jgi:hypothetical protein
VDSRGWLAFFGVLLALAGVVLGWNAWNDAQTRAETEAREARQEARLRQDEERVLRLIEESRLRMPDIIEGVALGMTLGEIRSARAPRITPARGASSAQQGELLMYEERLPNGGQVMYGFDRPSQRLVQVQLLSLLPTPEAVAPHLAAMTERYGTPDGIWDCPTTGGVPTRRFTWRGSQVTVSDVFLIYGERVSVTLYIATTEQIGRSLRMASCRPVPAERIGEFPVASAEQMQQAQGGR